MTVEIALVLIVIGGALYLFASERLPLDVTALLILVVVMLIPIVFHSPWLEDRGVDLEAAFPTVTEGLSGLSSPATVTVLCMFILSAGVQRSGLVHVLGRRLFPLVRGSELRQILVTALMVGPISGFVNNTAAVAVAIPLVLDMTRHGGFRASRLLMPVSFFAMLGGTLTLIGTSTNILASVILADDPIFGREIGMFEFTHLGLIVLGVGFLYFIAVGRHVMPTTDATPLPREKDDRFVVELKVPDHSDLAGQTLAAADFTDRTGVEVLKLVRGDQAYMRQAEDTEVAGGDILLVRASLRQLLDQMKSGEVEVLSEFDKPRRVRGDGQLVSALLRNRMVFRGRSAGKVDIWSRYKARLVGIDTDVVRNRRLADEELHVGETVLLEVSNTELPRLRRHPDLVVLGEFVDDFDRRNMWIAAGIVVGVVAGAALTPLPIVLTAIAGVVAMVASGCVTRDDLYSGVSWEVIILLAGVIPLGIAMSKSGGADWLAELLAAGVADLHPVFVFMSIYLVTTLLTELVSNNAAAVVLVPVASSLATELGLEPLPLVLAVMFAASTSFLTPVGYQTNAMIFGTGVYRFRDFAKVGAPLNLLLMVVTSIGLWLFW